MTVTARWGLIVLDLSSLSLWLPLRVGSYRDFMNRSDIIKMKWSLKCPGLACLIKIGALDLIQPINHACWNCVHHTWVNTIWVTSSHSSFMCHDIVHGTLILTQSTTHVEVHHTLVFTCPGKYNLDNTLMQYFFTCPDIVHWTLILTQSTTCVEVQHAVIFHVPVNTIWVTPWCSTFYMSQYGSWNVNHDPINHSCWHSSRSSFYMSRYIAWNVNPDPINHSCWG